MPRVEDWHVFSESVCALKIVGRWGDCPVNINGLRKTLYDGLCRRAERGVWARIFPSLGGGEGVLVKLDTRNNHECGRLTGRVAGGGVSDAI